MTGGAGIPCPNAERRRSYGGEPVPPEVLDGGLPWFIGTSCLLRGQTSASKSIAGPPHPQVLQTYALPEWKEGHEFEIPYPRVDHAISGIGWICVSCSDASLCLPLSFYRNSHITTYHTLLSGLLYSFSLIALLSLRLPYAFF